MNSIKNTFSLSLLGLMLSCGLHAQSLSLKPASTADFVHQGELLQVDLPSNAPYTIEPIHYIQPIDDVSRTLENSDSGQRISSNEYWQVVKGRDIRLGVRLYTTGAEALVRLSRQGGNAEAIDTQKLEVLTQTPFGLQKPQANAIDRLYSTEQLVSTELFRESAGFKLRTQSLNDKLILRSQQNFKDNELIFVNVKEKGSPILLSLESPRKIQYAGGTLQIKAKLENSGRQLNKVNYTAKAIVPSGLAIPVVVDKQGQITLSAEQSMQFGKNLRRGEMLDLEMSAVSFDKGVEVRRNSRISVAISKPTARLVREFDLALGEPNPHALFSVEVASSGRYQIEGVIYGTNNKGEIQPIMHSQSAQWLEPGIASLMLPIDTQLLADSGLQAPYTIKDLRLFDQSRLNLLQRQADVASF